MKNNIFLALVASSFLIAGCGSQTKNDHEENAGTPNESAAPVEAPSQRKVIENFIEKNNLKGEFTSSGLYVVIDEPGKGENPNATSKVKVEYSGFLLNGNKFDGSAPGEPIEFGLNEVIPGWTEGLQLLKKGGKARLLIPSDLAYGPTGQGPIPPNSVLLFEVKLVDFQ